MPDWGCRDFFSTTYERARYLSTFTSSINRYREKRVRLLLPMFVDNGHAPPSNGCVAYWIVLAYPCTVYGAHANEAEQYSSSVNLQTSKFDFVHSKCSVRRGDLMVEVIRPDTSQGLSLEKLLVSLLLRSK